MDNRILQAIEAGKIKREEKLPSRTRKITNMREYWGRKVPELITESVARDRSSFKVTMKEIASADLKRAIVEEFPNLQVINEVAVQDGRNVVRIVEYRW